MPSIASLFGILVFMFKTDHNPPHIHVEYGEFEAVVMIHTLEVKGKSPANKKKKVIQWIIQNKGLLLENWELAEQRKELKSMPTLRK